MSDVINIAQLRLVQTFPYQMEVVEISELVASGAAHPGVTELRCMYHIPGWTTGAETYVWVTDDGHMMANATKEMEDGGRPPRSSDEADKRRLVYTSRRFADWRTMVGSVTRQEVVEDKSFGGFFTATSDFGLVPDVRRWCIEQAAADTIEELR